jgi:hypothetical protein
MIVQIITHTPLWVWGLLCALLVLGALQSRPRQVARWQLLALPLALLLLGLWSMAPAFVTQPWAAALWLLSLAVGARLGLRLSRHTAARWLPEVQRLQLPGSWLPMLLIVSIFLLRYVTNVAMAMHPQWRTLWQMQAPLAVAFGALSGLFLGRALGLLSLTRGTATHAPV